jgi:hypothetical protein
VRKKGQGKKGLSLGFLGHIGPILVRKKRLNVTAKLGKSSPIPK